MTLILKQIFGLLKLLNSDKATNQIAFGVAIGLILGFSPLLSLQSLLVLVCLIIFRIQVTAALLSAFFFSFVAFLIDPACDLLGRSVLETESLRQTFTTMYAMPLVPLTRFYNSIVMGSGIVALLLAPFVYVLAKILIIHYRATVVAKFQRSRFWHVFKATPFYNWYVKYEQLYA